jgi:adenylate cyclase class IV
MQKNIEIEIRGPLTAEKYAELTTFLDAHAKKTCEKDRVLIDYSTFLPGGVADRQKDIRLRVTNGVPEIIVKIGRWGENEQRKELSVTTAPGTFDTLTEIFAALGYEKGMLCVRKSHVYEYKDIEFALVEVPEHSYYYEAEKMAHSDENTDALTKEITDVCGKLNLPIFKKKEFFEYIETLNKEANEIFDASSVASLYFRERFGV